jgi:hypothetical protein
MGIGVGRQDDRVGLLYYICDARLPHDTKYGLHLFEPTTTLCPACTRTRCALSCTPPSDRTGSLSILDPADMQAQGRARPPRYRLLVPMGHWSRTSCPPCTPSMLMNPSTWWCPQPAEILVSDQMEEIPLIADKHIN